MVEDNELNREIATAIMEEIGLDVDCVEDGTDAVNIMSSAEGRKYDLIFMDIQMPKMNGYQATKAIRKLPDERKQEYAVRKQQFMDLAGLNPE